MFFVFVLLGMFDFVFVSEAMLPTLRIGFCWFNGDDDVNPPPGPAIMAITKASVESSDPIVPLPGKAAFNVEWQIAYTNTSYGAVMEGMKRMIGNRNPDIRHAPAHVVVGCGSSPTSMKVAPLSAFFGVPMVSWLSGSPALSNKLDYPFFLRTRGTSTGNGAGIIAVAHHFGWTRIGFLYQEESFYAGVYTGAFNKALSLDIILEGFLLYNFPDDVDHSVWAVTIAHAAASKCRVFGLAVRGTQGDDALEVGRKMNLHTRLLIFAMELADFYPYFPENLKADWVGMLGIDYSQSGGNSQADRFQNAWYEMTFDKMRDSNFIPEEWIANIEQLVPDVFTRNPFMQFQAHLFDAIMAVIIAYQSMLDNGLPGTMDSYGHHYLDALYNTSFTGPSGFVSFTPIVDREGGDRELTTFQLFNSIRGKDPDVDCCRVVQIGAVGLAVNITQIPFFPDGKSDPRSYDALLCNEGFGWQNESGKCIRCRPGTKSVEMASGGELICSNCEHGYFSNAEGGTACEICAPGKYNEGVGATQCDKCNAGSDCPGGDGPPISRSGYYLVSYAHAVKCTIGVEIVVNGLVERASVCLGNRPYGSQNLSCADGHAGPLCGACALHYSREETTSHCLACGISSDSEAFRGIMMLIVDLMWTAAFTILIGYAVLNDLKDRSNIGPVLIRVLAHWMAVCGVLGSFDWSSIQTVSPMADDDADASTVMGIYPSWIIDMVKTVFFFSRGIFPNIVQPQLRLKCLADYFGTSSSTKINLIFCWWLLYPILSGMWVVVFLLLLSKLVLPLKRLMSSSGAQESTLVPDEWLLRNRRTFFALLVYLKWDEMASRTLSGVMCVKLDSGEHVWLGDTRESCYDHGRNLLVTFILLVWFIGFPIVLLLTIHQRMKTRTIDKVTHSETIRLYGFFFRGLEHHFWWWEIVVKRLDLLCVLLTTYSSVIKDSRSKLVLYTIQAGAAWGVHAIAVPYLKLQCQLVDTLEAHALFTRFVSLGSLVLPTIFQMGFFWKISMFVICLALIADVLFFGEIVLHVAWLQSYNVLENIEALDRIVSASRLRSSSFANIIAKLKTALSFAHREKQLLAESALHIQWFGPGLPLNMSIGKLPRVDSNLLRNTCREVLWKAFHMGNEKQAEYCLSTIQGITHVLVDAGHDMPPHLLEVICIMALSLKHAHESEHIDDLIEGATYVIQDQLDAYIGESKKEGAQKNGGAAEHLWRVSGEDLQRLLLLLGSLTLNDVLRISLRVAKNLTEFHAGRQHEVTTIELAWRQSDSEAIRDASVGEKAPSRRDGDTLALVQQRILDREHDRPCPCNEPNYALKEAEYLSL